MSLDPDRTPVIVAAGQAESRDHALGPIELLERAARPALDAAPGLAATIERLTVVSILTRRAGPAPASDLAKVLGLDGIPTEATSIGGNTPQAMLERAAGDIAVGRLRATLIAGAEAVRVGRLREGAQTTTADAASTTAPVEPDPVVGQDRQDLSDEERAAGIFMPLFVYPLFESVLATRAGRRPAEQRAYLGSVMAPFTDVAARHDHAWFREARTAHEVAEITDDNRLVVEPYTKRMVAFLGGAQSAAFVVTSLSVARELGLDDRAIFPWSAATAYEVWYPVARPDLGRAAGLELAAGAMFDAAGVGIDDVGLLDVYSCFPSAVQMGAAALGATERLADDPGSLTLTGGLPYFGGPGNNYTAHSIATMFDELPEARKGSLGVVTGVGWYLTKHSVGLYGTDPPPRGWRAPDLRQQQAELDATAVDYVPAGTGLPGIPARVDASTVTYDREGAPHSAPIVATLADGRRVVAAAAEADLPDLAKAVADRWLVGTQVTITAAEGDSSAPTYRLD